jgi:hypothetical protein
MSSGLSEWVSDIEKIVDDFLTEWDENIDDAVKGVPLDHQRPNDAVFVAFVDAQIAKDPTWLMRAAEAINGKEILDRYSRATGLGI